MGVITHEIMLDQEENSPPVDSSNWHKSPESQTAGAYALGARVLHLEASARAVATGQEKQKKTELFSLAPARPLAA
jgi:hypothetical protein